MTWRRAGVDAPVQADHNRAPGVASCVTALHRGARVVAAVSAFGAWVEPAGERCRVVMASVGSHAVASAVVSKSDAWNGLVATRKLAANAGALSSST